MTKLPKDFGRIKMEEEVNAMITESASWIRDTKRRTADRNKMDTMSVVAILAGLVALVALLLWAGTIVDAFIGVIGM